MASASPSDLVRSTSLSPIDLIKADILQLEDILHRKKNVLFIERLRKIIGVDKSKFDTSSPDWLEKLPISSFTNISFDGSSISNIDITVDTLEKTWCISYEHHTSRYDPSKYAYNDESADESDESVEKKTKIEFGKSRKHFIKGGRKLTVYRNTSGVLRITNPEYEAEIDLEEQKELMGRYATNIHLPEWLAIKTLLYFSDNKWDDDSIIKHFSIV